jgi:hypothetical protein
MSLPGAAPVVAQPLNGQNSAANIAAGIPQQSYVNPNAALQTPGTMGGNGATTSPVKLTANTSNAGASTTQTVPAPVVVNSQAATSYLGNVGQQVGNLQQNQQSQSAATAPVAPPTSAGSGSSTPTPTTTSTTPTPPADPSPQIQAIIDQLTQTADNANANANPPQVKSIYTAQEAQAIWGSNTAGLTQNPDGTFTASPEALASAGITDAQGNSTGNNVNGVQTSETLDQQANDVQTQLANGYAKMNSDLTAISNGTYPLTPSESSMISSAQEQMLQALQMQATANASYTGSVGESLASTGGLMGAQQMSMMQGAIAIGAQRTADLNSRLTQAIASLQDSFMKEDYTNVQDQWANTSKYFDDRAAAISDMQKTVATQVQNMITDARDQATTQISAIMDSANFGQKSYEDALTQANALVSQGIAQGTLTEKTNNDLATQADNAVKNHIAEATLALSQEKEAYAESQGSVGTIAGLPQVSMTADDVPDPTAQAQFLASLSPQTAAQVKGVADYTIPLSSFPTRLTSGGTGFTQQQMAALVSQYDPTYDAKQYATRQALQTNFTSGTYSQNINSLNTAIGHLVDLYSNGQGLSNTSIPALNAVKNSIESNLGSGNIQNATLNINASVGELASTFKGAGATDAEIANLGTIDHNSSPSQINSYIEGATQLLASRLDALQQTYTAGMGKAPTQSFLSSSATAGLLQLQQDGLDIQVPQLSQTPQVQLQTYYDASPQNAALITQVIKENPSLANDPQGVENYLQQQGISL